MMTEPTGQLSLTFRRKESGKTYLAKQYFKLPLQIMTPFYQDQDGTAFVYMLNPSGGILQHDRLKTEIVLEAGSRALLTTPSNTKFYRMDDGFAKLQNRVTVAAGGVLEYLPEHNVPFANTSAYQETEFHLHEDAILIASDMVTAGRVNRGEVFEYDVYSSKTKFYAGGKIIAFDSCHIRPRKAPLSGLGMMEGYLTNGTLYIYAKGKAKELPDLINGMERGSEVYLAAGAVSDDFTLVRFLGNQMIDLNKTMLRVWDLVRRHVLGKPSVRIRKY